MRDTFTITSNANLRTRYRTLLEEDFSERTLDECVALLRRVLETSGWSIRFAWETLPVRRPKHSYEIPAAASDWLREYLERNNADLADDMPAEIPEGTVWDRMAQIAAVLLTFQSRVNLEGETGFARDVQSLLFLQSLNVLSPKLEAKGLDQAEHYLVHALYAHAKNVWTDHPSHQNYLLGMLFEHIGQLDEAMTLLLASLNNSSVEEHDFVTKVQTYWSMLIEASRFEEAKGFLLSQYRRAAQQDLAELEEMLDETYVAQHATRRAS